MQTHNFTGQVFAHCHEKTTILGPYDMSDITAMQGCVFLENRERSK